MLELQSLTLIRKRHLTDATQEEHAPQEEACHASLLAHKVPPFMQNKANFRRADNDCNLSSNKHLRTQTAPGGPKKQSQSPKTPKSAQTQSAQRLTKKPPAGAEKRTNPKPNPQMQSSEAARRFDSSPVFDSMAAKRQGVESGLYAGG
jgi:hypothetical protein